MKIRYLPIEDRNNLRVLRHTNDNEIIVAMLESLFRRPYYTLQILWEYRKWFLQLTEEQLDNSPALAFGLSQIYLNMGDKERFEWAASKIPKDSQYFASLAVCTPSTDAAMLEKVVELVRKVGLPQTGFPLTAGRPTVLDGIWDLSASSDYILENEEEITGKLDILFPTLGDHIYWVLRAEILYWRNDCYNALLGVVGIIPSLKEKQDMRLLFVALTLEMYILLINGQASSEPMIENLRAQISAAGLEEYLPNIDALEAWSAMYDGDIAKVARWMREGAPDEHAKFCMLNQFRYFVKMRAYIIQGKYMAASALGNKMLPIIKAEENRKMDLCELYLILAMNEHAAGNVEQALEHLNEALKIAKERKIYRMVADEGVRIYELLKIYRREKSIDDETRMIIKLCEDTAVMHPKYLRGYIADGAALTETEIKVLRLIAEGCSNVQIASITETAVDTVKQHCKHIFAKLEVENRMQAANRAVELGITEPIKSVIS